MAEITATPPTRRDITGLLLAGGRGLRMGGADKGLLPYRGRPLGGWALDALAPQVGPLLINANRHATQWAAFGHPVIADSVSGFAGPLAGLQAGLAACVTPWLACVPCDAPNPPVDLVARLADGVAHAGVPVGVARCQGRVQPVFALIHVDARAALDAFLASGGRRVGEWVTAMPHVAVDFDDPAAFANLNTPESLAAD